MAESRRNISPGFFVLVLMIVFFSFFQNEKEGQTETTGSVISVSDNSGLQAIVVPEIQNPATALFWIKKQDTRCSSPDYNPVAGPDLSNRECCRYTALHPGFHSFLPFIGFIFPQKVPEQGNDDDLPFIA